MYIHEDLSMRKKLESRYGSDDDIVLQLKRELDELDRKIKSDQMDPYKFKPSPYNFQTAAKQYFHASSD